MGALAQLSESSVRVEPGETTTITLTVRNTGTVVDRYTFQALGAGESWVSFDPPSLSLFPEASETVEVLLSPPRNPTTAAGPIPLGVRVASSEDPAGSVVEEATVVVGAFSDITVELTPAISSGRFVARVRIAVDNRSNCDYRAAISGSDPKSILKFGFRPPLLEVPPGGAVFARLAIRPTRRFWRGSPQTRPYRVTLQSDQAGLGDGGVGQPNGPVSNGGTLGLNATAVGPAAHGRSAVATAKPPTPHKDVVAEGSMVQEPMLPRWLLGVLAVLVALVILWFTLLKPQIRSTAQNQVNKQVAQALGASTGGGSPAAGGGGGGGGSGSVVSTFEVDGGKQASGNGTVLILTVPLHRYLQVTDLLVQNAAGESGEVSLAQNGAPLMQWAMADFRDLDYHWITPTVFGPGTKVELIVTGCTDACTPGIYYAGHLVSVPG